MEEIKETLNALLAQMTGLKDDMKKMNNRMNTFEAENEARNPVVTPPVPLARARNEFELKEVSTLPDCVKELQTFEGQPERYVSWVNRAQAILDDYEVIKGRPLFRAILVTLGKR